jgi:Mce-associated membrane protein
VNAQRRGWTSVPVLVMTALALACAIVAAVLLATSSDASAPADPNQAVVDRTRTAQVVGQVDTDLEHVLSYDYRNPDTTRTAAHQALVGDALKQYDVLFTALQNKAGGQKLVLTAKVVNTGVTILDGARAQLLVFLDQTSTRASDGATNTSAAQIRITAVEQGGTWKISELVPL